jgi:hypothetical protein
MTEYNRIPILVPGPSKIELPDFRLPVGTRPFEQRLGGSTRHHDGFVSEDEPPKHCAEVLF